MSTFERLKLLMVEHGSVSESLVTPEATFIMDLGLDSLDLVEIVMLAEDTFGAPIDDEALGQIHTVQDAVSAIDHALSHRGAAA